MPACFQTGNHPLSFTNIGWISVTLHCIENVTCNFFLELALFCIDCFCWFWPHTAMVYPLTSIYIFVLLDFPLVLLSLPPQKDLLRSLLSQSFSGSPLWLLSLVCHVSVGFFLSCLRQPTSNLLLSLLSSHSLFSPFPKDE